jgi:hypothetical protein
MTRWPARYAATFALVAMLVGGCAGTGLPDPTVVGLPAVADALRRSGITVAEVTDNLPPDAAWQCLPGSFRLARISQQPVAAFAHPGDRPSVQVLIFASQAERMKAQAAVDAGGQVQAQGCAVMVEWMATPHVVGARNVILFIVTDDPAAVAAVQAAGTLLGG